LGEAKGMDITMFKALIVDDEPQIRKGLRTIVPWESYGFVVVGEAVDGVEALTLAREQVPDLVITDVKMPRMNGMDLSRALRAELPDTQVLVLSGYNEFAFAKEALKFGVMDYLLKPVDPDELGRSLLQVYDHLWSGLQHRMKEKEKKNTLRDFFLSKLIKGEIHKDVIEAGSNYDIDLSGEQFIMMIVSIDRYGEFLLSLPGEEIGWKRYAMGNVIQELLPSKSYLFDISEQQFGILLCNCILPADEGLLQQANAMEIANRITECMISYVKESVTVGIGTMVNTPMEIRYAYQTAQKALEKRFYQDTLRVLMYDRQDDAKASSLGLSWDDQPLYQSIREGSAERIRLEVDRLLQSLDGQYMPLNRLKVTIISTIIRLAKMTEEYHGEWQSFFTGRYNEMEHILDQGYMKQLNDFLFDISWEISQYIYTVNNRKIDNRIREILEYMEQHYQNELNLKELSKLFYINTVYLGQLFKKETGEYFNDYINKVRIGHASRMLGETSLSAAAISEAVGYKYVDHFYRQFKLQYGVNPGEFRRNLMAKPSQTEGGVSGG
jgi:two-component system response regulator YesN